jgi:phosphohistidine phosphatase
MTASIPPVAGGAPPQMASSPPMLLYFVRHGKAAAGPRDAERPLTDDGADEMRRVARKLAKLGVAFDATLASPLIRARQTAEVLAAAGIAGVVEECAALAPGGTLDAALDRVAHHAARGAGRVALVGHEPTLSAWAAHLAGGPTCAFELKKGGIVGLELPDRPPFEGRATLFWLTSPKLL